MRPARSRRHGRCRPVADVARRQHQRVRASDAVDERVDLGRPATARPADRLRRTPPLWNGPPLIEIGFPMG